MKVKVLSVALTLACVSAGDAVQRHVYRLFQRSKGLEQGEKPQLLCAAV